jgi:type II secretory pathway pseudopilin PulG
MKMRPSSAFTLIETITAMAVILVLTGLVISISGYVTKKGAQSRALGEIAMLTTACDSYHADAGTYPRDVEATTQDSKTDRLSPKLHFNPTAEEYEEASEFLYEQLTGDGNRDGKPGDGDVQYLKEFDPKILNVDRDANGKIIKVKYFKDPFAYGYSTAAAAAEAEYQKKLRTGSRVSRPAGDSMPGFNSAKFDMWSTGGSKPAQAPGDDNKRQEEWAKWIKNW